MKHQRRTLICIGLELEEDEDEDEFGVESAAYMLHIWRYR